MYFLFDIRQRKFFLWTFDPAQFAGQRTGFFIGLVVDNDSSAELKAGQIRVILLVSTVTQETATLSD
jgi:hypothetical protein